MVVSSASLSRIALHLGSSHWVVISDPTQYEEEGEEGEDEGVITDGIEQQ